MRSYLFDVKRHEEYGELGLALHGRRWADPLGGMAAAHDILEHFPGDDGTTEHELLALGASMLVRDESNYYAQKGQHATRPSENIASDMPEQCRYMANAGRACLRPLRTTRLREDWAEEEVQAVHAAAVRICRGEDMERSEYAWLRNPHPFIDWIRAGYRKAQRRYRGIASYSVCATFMEIERQADQFLKHAEEGMQCRIRVDVDRGRVKLLDLSYPEEW